MTNAFALLRLLPMVVGAGAVQDGHPQHGRALGHVVVVEKDRVAVLDVCAGVWLPVGAEGLLKRRHAGRGARLTDRRLPAPSA
ncbi:hypothetical protein ACFYOT_42620 [Saccharothrix saharensis]|uniref:hypothetical protein n=1 Tax=Saccharothrix saharensis TaxID=571190 RepID=UPI0036AB4CB8